MSEITEYTVEETETGLIISFKGMTYQIDIPNFSQRYSSTANAEYVENYHHIYFDDAYLGRVATFESFGLGMDYVFSKAVEGSAPTVFDNDVVYQSGSSVFVAPYFGLVHTYNDFENKVILNTTYEGPNPITGGHLLDPGYIIRFVYQEGDSYKIATFGQGYGNLGFINTAGSDFVWGWSAQAMRSEAYSDAVKAWLGGNLTALQGQEPTVTGDSNSGFKVAMVNEPDVYIKDDFVYQKSTTEEHYTFNYNGVTADYSDVGHKTITYIDPNTGENYLLYYDDLGNKYFTFSGSQGVVKQFNLLSQFASKNYAL